MNGILPPLLAAWYDLEVDTRTDAMGCARAIAARVQ